MPELREIAPDDDGIRLDRWFKRHYPALTHGRLEKLLRKGEVRLDGKRAKAGDRVIAGQSLRLPLQVIHDKTEARPKQAQAVKTSRNLQDAILYMDKNLFVLNKPAGLATQGGSGLTEHVDGMLDQLTYEKTTRPKLVHRLDKDTSGVLLVARTAQAASGLSKALASRDASKVYWALVKGVPAEKRGLIKAALAKEGTRGQNERMTILDDEEEGAKFALTEYAVMGQAGQEFSWIAARPVTGRTHQIRVHLASLGTPIIGDFKYGGTESRGRGAIADKLHLHARSIDIARPDGGRLQVTAPLSPHMVKSWAMLGFDPDDRRDPFPKTRVKASGRPVAREEKKPLHVRKEKISKKRAPKKKNAGREIPRKKR
jgi:23S rRNA pseudouridine955/2504/2580 synthase